MLYVTAISFYIETLLQESEFLGTEISVWLLTWKHGNNNQFMCNRQNISFLGQYFAKLLKYKKL